MRLFVALDIDDDIRGRITRFLDDVRKFAPEARWVRPESLHVTLKFIGEKSEAEAEKIKLTLRTIEAAAMEMNFRGFGFFPEARAPRVFWVGIEAGSALTSLGETMDNRLSSLNIPKEGHAFNAHLTLARGGRGSGSARWRKGDGPNRTFQRLQEKLAAQSPPEFGTMTAREFFLYQSQLSPGGSKYMRLAGFGLQ
ncbi:MAG: RNA 2',3'-cyclic phosphodiesterase [Candidatus Sulfotelmatobacter sp.]|jgi:2'-5' RNA ligase